MGIFFFLSDKLCALQPYLNFKLRDVKYLHLITQNKKNQVKMAVVFSSHNLISIHKKYNFASKFDRVYFLISKRPFVQYLLLIRKEGT